MSKLSKFLHDRWGFGGIGTGQGIGAAPLGAQIPAVGGPQRSPQMQMPQPMMPAPQASMDLDPRDDHDTGVGDVLRSVGGAAKEYGPLALAGLSAYEGWQKDKKAEQMMERAIAEEQERKQRVLQGIEESRAFEARRTSQPRDPIVNESNPYRRRIPAVGGGY